MFPFKKPPTKLEVATRSVSDAAQHLIDAVPIEKIEGKLDDLKKGAALAALQAVQVAHHAGDLAAHKLEELQTLGAHFGEGVFKSAHSAAQTTQSAAQTAAQSARANATVARETLGEKAETLRHSALESASALRETLRERTSQDFKIGSQEAQHAKERAQKVAQREAQAARARAEAVKARAEAKGAEIARKAADEAEKQADLEVQATKNEAVDAANAAKSALADEKAAIERAAREAKSAAENEARNLKKRAEKDAQTATRLAETETSEVGIAEVEVAEVETSEVEVAQSGSKWGWILLGLALGAIAALLFAPTSGRRSRAAIKDRLGKVSDGAVDAVTATSDKVVDIAHRVEGLANKAEAKLSADGETDDDGTIADRVRSVLGHHEIAKTLDRLNIDCAEGVITLRGPLVDGETEQVLIAAVSAIPGVKSVVADFLLDEEPANPAESNG